MIVMRVAFIGAAAISVFRMVAIRAQWFAYWSGSFYQRPWFRFDSILLGCAIALLFCDSIGTDRFRANFSGPAIPVVIWPSILAWSVWGESLTQVGYLTIQTVLALLLLVHLLLCKESLYLQAFSHPIAAWVGRLSYSLYLWQQLFTIQRFPSWGGLRSFPFNIVVSLLFAVGSYFLVERPFLRLKDRFGHLDE